MIEAQRAWAGPLPALVFRALMALSLLAAALVPALSLGGDPASALRILGFLALYVLLPGAALTRLCLGSEGGALREVGCAVALGIVLQALIHFASTLLHAPQLFAWSPVLFAALAWFSYRDPAAALRSPSAPMSSSARGTHMRAALCVLVVCLGVALLRTQIVAPDQWWVRSNLDLQFHAANAAEYARGWPMQDPRLASLPLSYHVLSYALAAGAASVCALPISELTLYWLAPLLPLVLVLQSFNAARALAGDARAGALAALLVAWHSDLEAALRRVSSAWSTPAVQFQNFFDAGVYISPPTCSGLMVVATLVLVLTRWFGAPRAEPRCALLLVLLGAFASGAKGSVMPVVLGGMGLCALFTSVRARRLDRRATIACACLFLAALPFLWWLSRGADSYAGAMFRFSPLAAQRGLGAFPALAEALGYDPRAAPNWLAWSAFPVWLIAHHGAALVLSLGYGWHFRRELSPVSVWLAGMFVVGVSASSLLASPGYSELFFVYNAHLGLCILAGVALCKLPRPRAKWVLLAAAPFALALVFAGAARCLSAWRERAPDEVPAITQGYREGLEWLRMNTPAHAVLIARPGHANLSTFAERRNLFELERFTPAAHAARWRRVDGRWVLGGPAANPYPDVAAAAREALDSGERAALEACRRWAPPGAPLYLVCDSVRNVRRADGAIVLQVDARPACLELQQSPALERVFQNAALSVHRVRSD